MARISEETIRRVAEATDIVDLISSYFPLKRAGTGYKAVCPFHSEKTPSFHVNPSRQTYKCFGCGAAGTVFRFLMEYEHVEFAEAVRRLAGRAGIPIVEDLGSPEDNQKRDLKRRLLSLHATAAAWFHENLLRSPLAADARDYLKSRDLGQAIAREWLLGYAPDSWDAIIDHLRSSGFSTVEIQQSGLVSQREDSEKIYSRFRDRVMFPIRNDYGEVIAFSGRLLDATASAAKYVNSPETPIFTKGRVLYGLDKSKRAIVDAGTAIVLEGQIDLIRAYESGVHNVIAPQGTAFTPEQARLLSRFASTAVLCFDSDLAGQEAAVRSLPALIESGVTVRVAPLPAGEDPDSFIRKNGADAFRSLVDKAKDFFEHSTDRAIASGCLDEPSKKASAAKFLASHIALLQDPVLRDSQIGRLSARLDIPPSAILALMKESKPRHQAGPQAGGDPPSSEPLALSPGIEMLCQLAIASQEVREWLASQVEPPLAELAPGAALLAAIVASPSDLATPGGLSAFASTLPEPLEKAIAILDLSRRPSEAPLEACQEAWSGLAAAKLREKQEILKARLRQPGLDADESLSLQKQILDLGCQLNDLFRPSV
ncbi:MAG: hypothetical protein Fur0032_12690 [Terrimicrobiaceae bacterium]